MHFSCTLLYYFSRLLYGFLRFFHIYLWTRTVGSEEQKGLRHGKSLLGVPYVVTRESGDHRWHSLVLYYRFRLSFSSVVIKWPRGRWRGGTAPSYWGSFMYWIRSFRRGKSTENLRPFTWNGTRISGSQSLSRDYNDVDLLTGREVRQKFGTDVKKFTTLKKKV